jgi:hypothetical protein
LDDKATKLATNRLTSSPPTTKRVMNDFELTDDFGKPDGDVIGNPIDAYTFPESSVGLICHTRNYRQILAHPNGFNGRSLRALLKLW